MEQYYVVTGAALPEIFIKVAETTRLLETGEASTINEATQRTGISRSAFYKYRDTVRPLQNMLGGRILTFQMTLRDVSGLLSSVLTIFAQYGANILTINQTIPSNGCAGVTVSADTAKLRCTLDTLLATLRATNGVLKADLLAG